MTVFACNSNSLKITIENPGKEKAYLFNTETNILDSTEIINSNYTFNSIDINEPTLFYLYFENINSYDRPNYIILSNQETEINFTKLIPINIRSQNIRDLYPNVPSFISDPNDNKSFYDFQELHMSFYQTITDPQLEFDSRKTIYQEFINKSEEIIQESKEQLVSAFIIQYLMNNNLLKLDQIQQFYSYLNIKIQQSYIGKKIGEEVGFTEETNAPNFNITDSNGKKYNLGSLKGKKILIHFWSSTCAPCIEEAPILLNLKKDYPDLFIINISLDSDKNRWNSGMTKHGITEMVNYCDFKGNKGKIVQDYMIKSIPANYLISETGKIIVKRQKLSEIIEMLN